LLAWAATIALPESSFRNFLLFDEVTLLAIAAVDPFLPKGFPLRRISSPARTFLTMSAAALLSMLVFVVPPSTLWRPTRVKMEQENPTSPV
jgi:hypothetical protein